MESSLKRDLVEWVALRSGGRRGMAIWYHKGILRNSINGIEVAGIHGIEIVRLLANRDSHSYLSKKFFLYVDKSNNSQPIETFKKQPAAPSRKVNPLKVMEELVTISPLPTATQSLNATITWPGGRKLQSKKLILRRQDNKLELGHIASAYEKKPMINKWISFQSPQSSARGRSQELYSISSIPWWQKLWSEKISMTYRRFGEAPAWMGSGRGAIVELQASRYPTISALPKDVLELFSGVLGKEVSEDYGLGDFIAGHDLLSNFQPWYRPFLPRRSPANASLSTGQPMLFNTSRNR
eukprot:gene467-505_t